MSHCIKTQEQDMTLVELFSEAIDGFEDGIYYSDKHLSIEHSMMSNGDYQTSVVPKDELLIELLKRFLNSETDSIDFILTFTKHNLSYRVYPDNDLELPVKNKKHFAIGCYAEFLRLKELNSILRYGCSENPTAKIHNENVKHQIITRLKEEFLPIILKSEKFLEDNVYA